MLCRQQRRQNAATGVSRQDHEASLQRPRRLMRTSWTGCCAMPHRGRQQRQPVALDQRIRCCSRLGSWGSHLRSRAWGGLIPAERCSSVTLCCLVFVHSGISAEAGTSFACALPLTRTGADGAETLLPNPAMCAQSKAAGFNGCGTRNGIGCYWSAPGGSHVERDRLSGPVPSAPSAHMGSRECVTSTGADQSSRAFQIMPSSASSFIHS